MSTLNKLKRPDLPGAADMTKLNTASAGVSAAKDAVTNMNYDAYKQGSGYAGLKKSYEQQGQKAMQDTLGQVAARTGGLASSYAGSAAQQSYNNYMQTLEDAARAQFNDEYSKAKDNYNMALQDYQNAYDEYRDQYSDAWTRYNAENSAYETDRQYNKQVEDEAKQDEIDRVYNSAYYGEAPTFAEYQAAGGTLDEATYNSIVLEGSGKRTDEGRADVDTEYESIFGAEGFNWDEWLKEIDADGDGTPGEDEDLNAFFGKSSYGEDYWKQYAEDEAAGRADSDTQASQTSAANDITARIANGESLEDIAAEYEIGTGDNTWESVTGKSKAEWTNFASSQNEEKTNSFIKSHTPETIARRAAVEGQNMSENEKAALDYYYGSGTADKFLSFCASNDFLSNMTDLKDLDLPERMRAQDVQRFYTLLPDSIPDEVIYPYIEKHYPKAYEALIKYSKDEE